MWAAVVALLATAALARAQDPPAPCEEARIKCALRDGCGMALQHYLIGCSAVLQGPAKHCPEVCQHSLIALTSTEEGRDLMNCQCSDAYCEESKQRVEICRASVTAANRNESVVTCTAAQWICAADTLCTTALEFYRHHCRSMFQGRKCSHRCQNSINILRRQEKAAKLKTCRCNGHADCARIQANMARLCFHKKAAPPPPPADDDGDVETNVVQVPATPPPRAAAGCLMPLPLLVAAAAIAVT